MTETGGNLSDLSFSSAMSALVRTRLPHLFCRRRPFPFAIAIRISSPSSGRSIGFFRLNEGYLQLHPHLTGKWPVGLWDWHSKIHATSGDGALYGHLHRLCVKVVRTLLTVKANIF